MTLKINPVLMDYLYSLLDDEGAGLKPLVELLHHFSDKLIVV